MYRNEEFWIENVIEKYSNCKQLIVDLATMFGSTFLKINFLKNKYRTKLTDFHIKNTLRISCSPRVPNFQKLKKLAKERNVIFRIKLLFNK